MAWAVGKLLVWGEGSFILPIVAWIFAALRVGRLGRKPLSGLKPPTCKFIL
jgi:hypothetical protein